MRCLCWKSQPGHAWCRSHSTEPTGVSKQRAGQGVQLHGIIVHGPNGTVYDLSSAFNPDVDDYGTSVPPSFVNGSLCILPGNGKAPGTGCSLIPLGAAPPLVEIGSKSAILDLPCKRAGLLQS